MSTSIEIPKEPYKCAGKLLPMNSNNTTSDCHVHQPHVALIPYSHKDITVTRTAIATPRDRNLVGSSEHSHNSTTVRPTAKVTPLIQRHELSDKSMQTDSLSIDLDSLIHIEDYRRSQRIQGLWDTVAPLAMSPGKQALQIDDRDNEIARLEARNRELEILLKTQNKVNSDLKKLLLASIGDDLTIKFEHLSSEAARMSSELHDCRKERGDLQDHFDQLSIEADMWKSKFVAGRVMLDELASWKAQLSIRYSEAMNAVKALLQERRQLRNDLVDTHLTLSNDQTSILKSTIELSVSVRQLAEKWTSTDAGPSKTASSTSLAPVKRSVSVTPSRSSLLAGVWCFHSTAPNASTGSNGSNTTKAMVIKETTAPTKRCEHTHGETLALEAINNQSILSKDPTMRYFAAYNSPSSKTFEKLSEACSSCRGEVTVL